MSRPARPGHSRKFPTRISQEELKIETMKYLASKGANFHFQSRFYAESTGAVLSSGNPKLVTLIPRLKDRSDNEAWAEAYEFAYHFLESHRMQQTLHALRVEFGGAGEPIRVGTFDQADRNAFFQDLLLVGRESFAEQLASFGGQTE
jgi:hypothetical protein